MKARVARWNKVFAATLVLAPAAAALVGWTYEQVGRRRDRQLYPQIGHSIDIGGRSLNIYCSGIGSPTVVFEAGGNGGGFSWALVQPKVGEFTRACWYDRAGEGWSDPPSDARTSASVTNDLHELLKRANVTPPYVVVGASIGGEYVLVFTAKFPSEVAGMVLVDSSHPDQREPPSMKSSFNLMSSFQRQVHCTALPVMSRFGILRLMQRPRSGFRPPSLAPEHAADVSQVFRNRPVTVAMALEQVCAATKNGKFVPESGTGNPDLENAVRAAGGLGNLPLIVLTAGQQGPGPPDSVEAREVAEFHEVWVHQLQAQLASLSTRGRQIVVANSGHGINYEAPDAVINAVGDVVNEARALSLTQGAK
ncbi:MAG TPA: alpha/beta hydrolase [Terriglobales bacterium]